MGWPRKAGLKQQTPCNLGGAARSSRETEGPLSPTPCGGGGGADNPEKVSLDTKVRIWRRSSVHRRTTGASRTNTSTDGELVSRQVSENRFAGGRLHK